MSKRKSNTVKCMLVWLVSWLLMLTAGVLPAQPDLVVNGNFEQLDTAGGVLNANFPYKAPPNYEWRWDNWSPSLQLSAYFTGGWKHLMHPQYKFCDRLITEPDSINYDAFWGWVPAQGSESWTETLMRVQHKYGLEGKQFFDTFKGDTNHMVYSSLENRNDSLRVLYKNYHLSLPNFVKTFEAGKPIAWWRVQNKTIRSMVYSQLRQSLKPGRYYKLSYSMVPPVTIFTSKDHKWLVQIPPYPSARALAYLRDSIFENAVTGVSLSVADPAKLRNIYSPISNWVMRNDMDTFDIVYRCSTPVYRWKWWEYPEGPGMEYFCCYLDTYSRYANSHVLARNDSILNTLNHSDTVLVIQNAPKFSKEFMFNGGVRVRDSMLVVADCMREFVFKADSAYGYIVAGAVGDDERMKRHLNFLRSIPSGGKQYGTGNGKYTYTEWEKDMLWFHSYYTLGVRSSFNMDNISLKEYIPFCRFSDLRLCKKDFKKLKIDSAYDVRWYQTGGRQIVSDSVVLGYGDTGRWYVSYCGRVDSFRIYGIDASGNLPEIDTGLCKGESLVVQKPTNTTMRQYSWVDGAVSISKKLTGNQTTAIVVSKEGCNDTVKIKLSEIPLPDFEIVRLDKYCGPTVGTIWLTGKPDKYQYHFTPPGLEDKGKMGYTAELTVKVEAKSKEGCLQQKEYIVRDMCAGLVYVPGSFTPDGDGLNDRFNAVGAGFTVESLEIYSRWGELVYRETGNKEGGWNGEIGGEASPCGVYVYKIRAQDTNGRWHQKTGSVTLLR
jgi:gliding motility-associated-like protein